MKNDSICIDTEEPLCKITIYPGKDHKITKLSFPSNHDIFTTQYKVQFKDKYLKVDFENKLLPEDTRKLLLFQKNSLDE